MSKVHDFGTLVDLSFVTRETGDAYLSSTAFRLNFLRADIFAGAECGANEVEIFEVPSGGVVEFEKRT